jgi:hypothetical protein
MSKNLKISKELKIISHQGKCKLKTTKRHHYTPTRMAILKKRLTAFGRRWSDQKAQTLLVKLKSRIIPLETGQVVSYKNQCTSTL